MLEKDPWQMLTRSWPICLGSKANFDDQMFQILTDENWIKTLNRSFMKHTVLSDVFIQYQFVLKKNYV